MALNRRQALIAGFGAMAAAVMPVGASHAEDSIQASRASFTSAPVYQNVVEASDAAGDYALEQDAIGIYISFGAFDGAPDPADVGNAFQEEIVKRGENAAYFIGLSETPGIAIGFDYGHTDEPARSPREAASMISTIVATKRSQREQLANLPEGDRPTVSFASIEIDDSF